MEEVFVRLWQNFDAVINQQSLHFSPSLSFSLLLLLFFALFICAVESCLTHTMTKHFHQKYGNTKSTGATIEQRSQ